MAFDRLHPVLARIAAAWRTANDAWHNLDDRTHHVLSILLKIALAGYFVFCALFLTARYVIWPHIENYKRDIETVASKAIGNPVSVADIRAAWDGLNPRLVLSEVVVRDKNGRAALTLPSVSATLSWWSIPTMQLRFNELVISRPELDIRRDEQGKIYIAGLLFDAGGNSDTQGADWVLKQNQIAIQEGKLRWIDDLRKAPVLALNDVQLSLQNSGHRHRLLLTAKPPASLSAPLDVRADFTHPYFVARISDVRQWRGEIYADLQNTDLTAWKPYFDYPFAVDKGFGSVRAWLTLDRTRVADFTADLSLTGVSAKLRADLEQLNLLDVSGRVSAREDYDGEHKGDAVSFGDNGHSVSLVNFTLRTKEGLHLPETTISEEFTPARGNAPEKTAVRTRHLDLQTLAKFTRYLPLTADIREMLADFAPSGQLKDFSLQWEGDYPDLVSYQVSGEFVDLTMKAQPPRAARPAKGKKPAQAAIPGIPGFAKLTGRVEANQKGGNFKLASENLTLYFPGYYADPAVPFESLKMQASWAFLEKQQQFRFEIGNMDFVQQGLRGSVSGKLLRPMNLDDKHPGTIDITARLPEVDVSRVGRYLPLQMADFARTWLAGALRAGTARDVAIRIKGDLSDFPFQPNSRDGKPKGELKATMQLDDVTLNYRPGEYARDGRSPLWPEAERINGTLAFYGTRMEIHAKSAKTLNVDLHDVSAIIPDILASDRVLEISGGATGPLQEFVRYANAAPVAGWIENFTEDTRATGDARLLLKFQMPLSQPRSTKVQGSLLFTGNDVHLFHGMPILSNAKGKLEFFETGFNLNGIGAKFLGGSVAISGGTQANGKFRVQASGNLTADGLRKEFPGMTPRISGNARYALTVNQKGRQPDVLIESNMRGIALDFPAPLRKNASDAMALKVQVAGLAPAAGGAIRDDIKLALGTAITAHYVRQKGSAKHAPWQVVRGGIGVNAPTPDPSSGVTMKVALPALNISEWQPVLGSVVGNKLSKTAESTDAFDASQYIDPDHFSVKTQKLQTSGMQLDNVDLLAEQRPGSWQIGVKSDQLSGTLNWVAAGGKQKEDKLTARLTKLNISREAAADAGDSFDTPAKPVRLPSLDVVADDTRFFGRSLGRVELVAGNTPGTNGREWNIDRLIIANPDATLKASGKWNARKGANQTQMTYAMDIDNAGKLLDRMGFANTLRDGKGKMEGSLEWKGPPFALDKPSLSGKMSLTLDKGQFLKAEPGVARLLGVMSLQTLPRRLTLDFRDIFSKGYAFDKVTATANIASGVIKTDNLKMIGASSTVLMEGTADIANETQNLHVLVIPDISPNVASAIYGIVVNPVMGVGTVLAQLVLRDPLSKVLTYEYQITGSWDQPTITKIQKPKSAPKTPPTTTETAKGAS